MFLCILLGLYCDFMWGSESNLKRMEQALKSSNRRNGNSPFLTKIKTELERISRTINLLPLAFRDGATYFEVRWETHQFLIIEILHFIMHGGN